MYMSRKHIGAAYSEIGRHYGGRNHATAIAAEKKVQKWLQSEKQITLLPGFETVGDLLYNLERAPYVLRPAAVIKRPATRSRKPHAESLCVPLPLRPFRG